MQKMRQMLKKKTPFKKMAAVLGKNFKATAAIRRAVESHDSLAGSTETYTDEQGNKVTRLPRAYAGGIWPQRTVGTKGN